VGAPADRCDAPGGAHVGWGSNVILTCAHCKHAWEDDLEEEVPEVGCTRCGQKTPFKLATQPPDATDAPTIMPTSTPTPSRPPSTPAGHVSMPTIQVGSVGAGRRGADGAARRDADAEPPPSRPPTRAATPAGAAQPTRRTGIEPGRFHGTFRAFATGREGPGRGGGERRIR
jgi:DNA-directed RNA polymerase subunit RPC12/RpoP